MTDRTYDVVFGDYGQEAQVADSGSEVWRSRRVVMALLKREANEMKERGLKDQAKHLTELFLEFQYVEVGALLFGYVRRWKNPNGKLRFIGVVPHGRDYRDLKSGSPVRTASSQPLDFAPHRGYTITDTRWKGPDGRKRPHEDDEAKSIANKMAKAARKAAENAR